MNTNLTKVPSHKFSVLKRLLLKVQTSSKLSIEKMRIHCLKLRKVNVLGQRIGGKRLWRLPLCWYLNHSLEAPGLSLSLLLAELLTIHFHPCLLHELPSQVTANQILALVSTGNRYKTINSIQPYCQTHHTAMYITTAAERISRANPWGDNRKKIKLHFLVHKGESIDL